MRQERFKMERQGMIEEGQTVTLLEKYSIPSYYYIIEPAVAMSGCIAPKDRIKSKCGIVKEIQNTDRGYYVILELDE